MLQTGIDKFTQYVQYPEIMNESLSRVKQNTDVYCWYFNMFERYKHKLKKYVT